MTEGERLAASMVTFGFLGLLCGAMFPKQTKQALAVLLKSATPKKADEVDT